MKHHLDKQILYPECPDTLYLEPEGSQDQDLLEKLVAGYQVYFGREAGTRKLLHVRIPLERRGGDGRADLHAAPED